MTLARQPLRRRRIAAGAARNDRYEHTATAAGVGLGMMIRNPSGGQFKPLSASKPVSRPEANGFWNQIPLGRSLGLGKLMSVGLIHVPHADAHYAPFAVEKT